MAFIPRMFLFYSNNVEYAYSMSMNIYMSINVSK